MRAYRILLHCYPTSFRHEYGGEMAALFARRLAAASNPTSRAVVWLSTIVEVLANAMLVHWDIARQDVRYVVRTWTRRTSGFALTAIAVIALGVGAMTAAFSVTDFVLIRPLPFPHADRLVKIWASTPGYSRMELAAPNYRDIKTASTSFESSGMYHMEALTLLDGDEPRRFDGSSVSADLFPTLGITPLLGRIFTPADDREGAPLTVILSYRLWQTQFGGDPGIVGRVVTATSDSAGGRYTIIGVMPREFHFPSAETLFWVPNAFGADAYTDAERNNNWIEAVARLRPGVTIEHARAEVAQIAERLRLQYPKENKDTGALVSAWRDDVPQRSRLLLKALVGAAACVLLIACANLANLLLARALDRRRELAVRAAIGAGRERLVRQLMTETLLLGAVGGAIGVGIASAAVPLLAQLVPSRLPIAETPTIDVRVLIFAIAVTGVTALVFGVAPLARFGAGQNLEALREGARSGGGARQRLRSALVVAEIGASVVLLVCAGLLLRALLAIQSTDPGFRPEGVLTMRAELPMPEYGAVARREAFYERVLADVRALPGVRAAGFISFLPISSFRGGIWPVVVEGDARAGEVRDATNVVGIRYITSGLFDALGTRLVRGRDVSAGDTRDRSYVAVVSESFARRYWPGLDPIGRHFKFAVADTADREVVGVVRDVRFRGLERTSEPQVYLPSAQVDDNSITFYVPRAIAVRSTAAPSALAPSVRAILRRADSRMAITEVQTLQDLIERDTESRAVQLRVIGAFAAIAFLLAAVGIHGLLSFAVSQRTQEIGVRIALGAQPGDVIRMIGGNGARLGAIGLVLGAGAAYAAGRSMQALLFGVAPGDVRTFGAAIGLVTLMLAIGTFVPTRRALGINPIEAIRAE